MNRLLLLIALTLTQSAAFGAIYKCERAGGRIEYQSAPCKGGTEITEKVNEGAASRLSARVPTLAGVPRCSGKQISLSFTDMTLAATLKVVADFSGNKLALDPAVSGSGAFNYQCVDWEVVLQDIATRHGLAASVDDGTIHVRPR